MRNAATRLCSAPRFVTSNVDTTTWNALGDRSPPPLALSQELAKPAVTKGLGPDRFYFPPLSHLYALRRFEVTPHAPLVQTRSSGGMGAKGGQECQEYRES